MIGTPRRWLLGVATLLLLVVGAFTFWRLSLKAQNRDRLKAIAARGEPVDSAALNLCYETVPEAENAGLIWLAAAGEMTVTAINPKNWPKFTLPLRRTNAPAADLEAVRGLVASNETALATFRQAAALSRSRYPIDLNQGMNTLLPHLSSLRMIARLLQAEAVVAVEDRDCARAADSVKTILAAGRSLSPEPLLASHRAAYGLHITAYQTAEYILNRLSLPDSVLKSLGDAFSNSEDSNSLSRALMGERAAFVTSTRDPEALIRGLQGGSASSRSVGESFQDLAWPIIRASGFFDRDFGFGVDALTTNIAFAKLPDPLRFAARTNYISLENRLRQGRYVLSSIFLSDFSKAITRDSELRARTRVAKTAIAVERYRLANSNTPPETMAALVPKYLPQLPIDPFDGQPLRFKALDSGYVVYSVGPDTRDDGGLERSPKPKDTDPWDLTFIVERP